MCLECPSEIKSLRRLLSLAYFHNVIKQGNLCSAVVRISDKNEFFDPPSSMALSCLIY